MRWASVSAMREKLYTVYTHDDNGNFFVEEFNACDPYAAARSGIGKAMWVHCMCGPIVSMVVPGVSSSIDFTDFAQDSILTLKDYL